MSRVATRRNQHARQTTAEDGTPDPADVQPRAGMHVGSIRLTPEHRGWCRLVHIARRSDADPEVWMSCGFIRADELHALLDAAGLMRQQVFGIRWPSAPSQRRGKTVLAAATTRSRSGQRPR